MVIFCGKDNWELSTTGFFFLFPDKQNVLHTQLQNTLDDKLIRQGWKRLVCLYVFLQLMRDACLKFLFIPVERVNRLPRMSIRLLFLATVQLQYHSIDALSFTKRERDTHKYKRHKKYFCVFLRIEFRRVSPIDNTTLAPVVLRHLWTILPSLFNLCQLLLPSTCSPRTLVDWPFHRVFQSPFSTVQTFHFCQFHLLEPFFRPVFNVSTVFRLHMPLRHWHLFRLHNFIYTKFFFVQTF